LSSPQLKAFANRARHRHAVIEDVVLVVAPRRIAQDPDPTFPTIRIDWTVCDEDLRVKVGRVHPSRSRCRVGSLVANRTPNAGRPGFREDAIFVARTMSSMDGRVAVKLSCRQGAPGRAAALP